MSRKLVRQRKDGYRLIWKPEHPAAHKGYVYEHRLVAEQTLGRPLTRHDIVHHINEDRCDNRPENLQVVTKGWHQTHHMSTSLVDDLEAKKLILAGYTSAQLTELRIWQHRAKRLRRELRAEGHL